MNETIDKQQRGHSIRYFLLFCVTIFMVELFFMWLSATLYRPTPGIKAARYAAVWFALNIAILLIATIKRKKITKKHPKFSIWLDAFRAAMHIGYSIMVLIPILNELILTNPLKSFCESFNLNASINLLAIYIALDAAINIISPTSNVEINISKVNINSINTSEANLNSL